ncbi:MAG: serine/threonine protein phosphatase [Planctomycetia bacterium]|nr:serine/threonine protein phosphatase [Planctomycetia bacterium]
MRTLALGDVHGCYRALTAVVEAAQLTDRDRLVTLGDYVDRGPDSRRVLDWLIARSQRGNLISLTGNHELMMLRARDGDEHLDAWLACGGDVALASYGRPGRPGQLSDVPDAHWNFMEHFCRDWFEDRTHFFVHANALPDMPLSEQPKYMLFWESFNEPPPHESGKIMVCGHTPQRSGEPKNLGHAVCIDTWVYGQGWLTCLDTATGEYWQANQQGEVRASNLEPPVDGV